MSKAQAEQVAREAANLPPVPDEYYEAKQIREDCRIIIGLLTEKRKQDAIHFVRKHYGYPEQ